VADGVMQPLIFLVDTDDAVIRMDGNINLAKETLDLSIHPKSKGVRLVSLRAPLYLNGTFKHPDVGVNKTVVGMKAGAAVVLGTVASPFAALLALVQPDAAKDNPCGKLLQAVEKKPAAPSLGKGEPHAESPSSKKP
jgi:uncharacterized protein involved in outer membrane biogenesis